MGLKGAFFATLWEIIQTALVSLIIFLIVYIFLVQPHRVKGDSMLPNFFDGELLLTEKVSYRFGQPERGDVIVFRAPVSQKVDFIKRIIGLPGDTVKIDDGDIFVNGKRLNEPYETQQTSGIIETKIGENEYFVLGDNRGASSDSRSFGLIKSTAIRGRTWLVYWPFVKSQKTGGVRIVSKVNYSQ